MQRSGSLKKIQDLHFFTVGIFPPQYSLILYNSKKKKATHMSGFYIQVSKSLIYCRTGRYRSA